RKTGARALIRPPELGSMLHWSSPALVRTIGRRFDTIMRRLSREVLVDMRFSLKIWLIPYMPLASAPETPTAGVAVAARYRRRLGAARRAQGRRGPGPTERQRHLHRSGRRLSTRRPRLRPPRRARFARRSLC